VPRPDDPSRHASGSSGEERRAETGDNTVIPNRRVFDTDFNAYLVPVEPGACVVTNATDEMLTVVVGSSIAACMRDPVAGIGGMNHFLLPGHETPNALNADYSLRFGHFAMEKLVNDLIARGAQKDRLEVKLFGGASVVKASRSIGDENIAFVQAYLAAEGLEVVSDDLGGLFPRRIQYVPKTGKIFRLLMRRSDDAAIFTREVDFREQLRHNRVEGTVTLFGKDQ
jgi:chemotaxis protein CheD